MGSTPHAHARAKAESPHHQGLCAMISVFIDTFVILNLTVFAVLTTDAMSSGKDDTALTQAAFMQSFETLVLFYCDSPKLPRIFDDSDGILPDECEISVRRGCDG